MRLVLSTQQKRVTCAFILVVAVLLGDAIILVLIVVVPLFGPWATVTLFASRLLISDDDEVGVAVPVAVCTFDCTLVGFT